MSVMSLLADLPQSRRMPMSRLVDQRTYQTFEEFEREELRRDGYFESVDSMIDEMFAGELDFEGGGGKRAGPVGGIEAEPDVTPGVRSRRI
jgi:hypothetical protein